MSARRLWIPLAGVALLAVSVLLLRAEFAPAPAHESLLVLCADDVAYPIEDIAGAFERRMGIRVDVLYDTPEALLDRMREGGSGDLWIVAGAPYVAEAEEAGLVSSYEPVAWQVPVLMVQPANPRGIEALEDVTNDGVRLGILSEETPVLGAVSREVFEKNGMPMERLAEHIALEADSVRELAQGIILGQADVGLLPRPAVRLLDDRAAAVPIPRAQNVPIPVSAVHLNAAHHRGDAAEFVRFMGMAMAQDLFRRHHFDTGDGE
jgi:molybdate transport system substrate-binding protein